MIIISKDMESDLEALVRSKRLGVALFDNDKV